jgi:exodeoxyribonuclease-1
MPDTGPDCTFFWHDYETFGADVRRDRPAQFAGVRTDLDLNEIGEPVMWYCQPAPDYLPDPQSCLITGITPQHALQHGMPETEFAGRIEAVLAQPGTIGVGYNTIRFDDEITRHLFWRNGIDPYAREWRDGCGRWDLLDVVRLAYALRPDGIQWPQRDDGSGPSFKLEHLTAANGLAHAAAHDALSDVRATVALARLLRDRQPKLFDFALGLRQKQRVAAELGLPAAPADARPFLHVSGMFGAERGCLAVMFPLAMHPTNRNELIAWDLAHDPAELATLSVDELRLRLFTRATDLPEGVARLPVKTIHLNKSPMVVGNLRVLQPAMAERWGIDLARAEAHAERARGLPDLGGTWARVFERPPGDGPRDVEQDLYGGFTSDADRKRLAHLRTLDTAGVARNRSSFDDPRLEELVFRWQARNFPSTLDEAGRARWDAHRAARLFEGAGGVRTLEQLFSEIDALSESVGERGEAVLGALYEYADAIAPDR